MEEENKNEFWRELTRPGVSGRLSFLASLKLYPPLSHVGMTATRYDKRTCAYGNLIIS